MKNQLVLLILLILVIPYSTINAAKIQNNESWVYDDAKGVKYNETVLEITQLTSSYDAIAVAKTNTTRGFSFPLLFDKYSKTSEFPTLNVISSMTLVSSGLYLTQEGGIPFLPVDPKLVGSITINKTDIYEVNNNVTFAFKGDPAIALTTTSSVQLELIFIVEINDTVGFNLLQQYVISTNDDITDSIRNFTFTPSYFQFTFGHQGTKYSSVTIQEPPRIGLNSVDPLLMTFNSELKLPIYIKQTEPAKIDSGLSLSQNRSYEVVEYFLVSDDIDDIVIKKSSTKKSSFYFLMMIVILPIITSIKRKSIRSISH